ncbi:fimbrial protein [Enterobacter bugandensis]|nr:fimbrial protein [Enterobacter bugandensis]EKS7120161.1 fimbrial protein [Enterobacter bugandensis]
MLLVVPAAMAWTESNTVNFRGKLIESLPCLINSGNTLEVDFGEKIGINGVNGVNYKQDVPYVLDCPAGAPPLTLNLMVTGVAASFDAAAVQTSVTPLGIRLLLGGAPLELNKRQIIDPVSPPVLQAVPVKQPGSNLPEGRFDATATLLAEYL